MGKVDLRTTDLSMGGAAIETREPIPVGHCLAISLMGPETRIELDATVRYCTARAAGEGFRVGLRFEAMTDSDRASLERAIQRIRERGK